MCNLYSITTNQEAIARLFRVINCYVGNLPPMPGVLPELIAARLCGKGGEGEGKVNNPWDVRPQPPMGDPDLLFAAIGQAHTEWENVESSLAELFAVFVSARGRSTFWKPAIQAYGSIISLKSRCDMLRVAGDAYFSTRKHIKR